jgi:hypothetical protein
MKESLLKLLEALKDMSQSEDWDENRAQQLVQWGGQLYDEYDFTLRRQIDDANHH